MRLIWTSEAWRDLAEIIDYISLYNGPASIRILRLIEETADRIPDHPMIFQRGRRDGTQEAVVHPNYLLIYQVREDSILVLNVIHTSQEYP